MYYKQKGKRILDVILSISGLIILSPLFIMITICLYFLNTGKPLFTQRRPGKNEQIFTLVKFRTMTDKRDSFGNLLPDKQRITRFGSFLRKTSLDELPQLFNVFYGDMSLIGPRPLLIEYLPLYNKEQSRRHEIRPGITGWAQVNGRNSISWQQKFEYDVWYVDHVSFKLDIKIFYLTFVTVFSSKGINASEDKTMEMFTGNQN